MIGDRLLQAMNDQIKNELEMIGDAKSALLLLDRELGARVFTPGSPLDPAAYKVVE